MPERIKRCAQEQKPQKLAAEKQKYYLLSGQTPGKTGMRARYQVAHENRRRITISQTSRAFS
jgi:hypothetical protein